MDKPFVLAPGIRQRAGAQRRVRCLREWGFPGDVHRQCCSGQPGQWYRRGGKHQRGHLLGHQPPLRGGWQPHRGDEHDADPPAGRGGQVPDWRSDDRQWATAGTGCGRPPHRSHFPEGRHGGWRHQQRWLGHDPGPRRLAVGALRSYGQQFGARLRDGALRGEQRFHRRSLPGRQRPGVGPPGRYG